MFRAFRQIGLIVLLALVGAKSGHGFSLLGPREDYQVEALSYLAPYWFQPKNLDDEYRWNTRVVYYSFDPEFTSYFGSNGIVAVENAFAIMNSLTNVSQYTNLSVFPLEALSANYTAEALQLLDLKSETLSMLVERLGLADPEQFTWTLRARALPPGAQCPAYDYLVIKRNFDPETLSPSSYVNGNLLSYFIIEINNCERGDAVEVLVDPLDQFFTSVATRGAGIGEFWRGLTRDDVGGLRYLLSTNNVNWETTPNNSFVITTNTSQPELLFPSNLQVFAEQSLTNDAAALQALWPGLQVTSTSNFFVNAVQTNVFAYFTNLYTDPVGTPPLLVLGTSYTTNVATRYAHTFGNVLTNQVYSNCLYSVLTTNIAPGPNAPVGSGISVTNLTLQSFVQTNCISGSFYILPTNVCAYSILYTQLTTVVTFTNFLTNTFVSATNSVSTNAVDYYEFSQSILTYFTNQILVAYPVSCPDDITSLFEGIEKVTFVRRDYDSLLGQFFQPVTNDFTLTEITNNTRVPRSGQRAISQPDILFTADDLVTGPSSWPIINPVAALSTPFFETPTNQNNQGPGTITPTVAFTFNKVGPAFFNSGPAFIDQATAFQDFTWGSFDGTTNAPIVYPVGSDLTSLANLAVMQLSQPNVVTNGGYLLPDGALGIPYNGAGFQLEGMGGTPPYTWTLAPGSASLPDGLILSPGGLISGMPGTVGIFDFSIRMTESAARFVEFPFTMTIQP